MTKPKKGEVTIMVSSSVYGMEDDLRQIYALLRGFGYRVWMSHMGSVPKNPGKSAFDDCLIAVQNCDYFLGIIRNKYGSGRADRADKSITHLEILEAIKLKKPRFFIADEKVVIARRLITDIGFGDSEARASLKLKRGAQIIDDLKILDMYEDATQNSVQLQDRKDNWVQSYYGREDLLRVIEEQFNRYADLHEQLIATGDTGKKASA